MNICAPEDRIAADPKIGRSRSHQKMSMRSNNQLFNNIIHKRRSKQKQPGMLMHQNPPMLSLEQQPYADLHSVLHSTPLHLKIMEIKEKILLLRVPNVMIHKRHNQRLHKSMMMMMTEIVTTMY